MKAQEIYRFVFPRLFGDLICRPVTKHRRRHRRNKLSGLHEQISEFGDFALYSAWKYCEGLNKLLRIFPLIRPVGDKTNIYNRVMNFFVDPLCFISGSAGI